MVIRFVTLHKSGEVIPVEEKESWEGEFSGNGIIYRASFVLNQYQNISDLVKMKQSKFYDPESKKIFGNSYIIHKDCYKIINDKIPGFSFKNMCLQKINYNEIYPYMRQEMPWMKYFLNNKEYLLESPDVNEKNRERIIDIIESMKFKWT